MKTTHLSRNTLQLLKAFIASHAVFNALTYVQNQIADDEKRAALKALSTFANFIRKTADEVDTPQRAVSKEWEMLSVYCQLEKWRFSDRLNIQIESVNHNNTPIPSFLFAPFIEQIILLGLLSKEEFLSIVIKGKELGYTAECNFKLDKDTLNQFNAEQLNRKELLDERVEILKEDFQVEMILDKQTAHLTINHK